MRGKAVLQENVGIDLKSLEQRGFVVQGVVSFLKLLALLHGLWARGRLGGGVMCDFPLALARSMEVPGVFLISCDVVAIIG